MDDGLDRVPLIPGSRKPEPQRGLRLPTLVLALVTVFIALSAFLVASGPASVLLPPPPDDFREPTPAQTGANLPSESPAPDLRQAAGAANEPGTKSAAKPAPLPTDPAPPTAVPSGVSFGPGMGAQTTPPPGPPAAN